MNIKAVSIGGFCAALTLVSGCASSSSSDGEDTSVVKEYSTILSVTKDSDLVLEGFVRGAPKLEAADEKGETGEKVPVYSIQVNATVKGAASDTVHVRGLGSNTKSDYPVLKTDGSYLLYLSEFMWQPGTPTGEYVITGQQGAFELKNGSARRVGSIGSLPASMAEKEALNQTR